MDKGMINMDVYTLVVEDCDALNKHIDCEMKCRSSCSRDKSREKEYVISGIVATPSRRGRPPKDHLVFVNTIPTSTSNTPLKHSTRLKK